MVYILDKQWCYVVIHMLHTSLGDGSVGYIVNKVPDEGPSTGAEILPVNSF